MKRWYKKRSVSPYYFFNSKVLALTTAVLCASLVNLCVSSWAITHIFQARLAYALVVITILCLTFVLDIIVKIVFHREVNLELIEQFRDLPDKPCRAVCLSAHYWAAVCTSNNGDCYSSPRCQ